MNKLSVQRHANITVYKSRVPQECSICGKEKSRHPGHSPAPVTMILVGKRQALCMSCAKRLSSRLDEVIDWIEAEYR